VQPGDAVYLYHWTAIAWGYYGRRFDLGGVVPIIGTSVEDDWDAYRRDLEPLRGRRVWFVFSHARAPEDVERVYLHLLRHMGRQIGATYERPGASVYLFDLATTPSG